MTILSSKTDIYKQFLVGNISNYSCIHAIQSNKYCLIHAIQSGGAYSRGALIQFLDFYGALIREGRLFERGR